MRLVEKEGGWMFEVLNKVTERLSGVGGDLFAAVVVVVLFFFRFCFFLYRDRESENWEVGRVERGVL